jgi:hypothetical protein
MGGNGWLEDVPGVKDVVDATSGSDVVLPRRSAIRVAGTGVSITDDPVNNRIVITFAAGGGGGSGDVVGPAGAIDNAIARYDQATGKLLQGSLLRIADDGALIGEAASSTPVHLSRSPVNMATDANRTLVAAELVCTVIDVTSSGALTSARDIILPATTGAFFLVSNQTTGAQLLRFKATTGAGVYVPSGGRALIWFDGTNYVSGGAPRGIVATASPSTSQNDLAIANGDLADIWDVSAGSSTLIKITGFVAPATGALFASHTVRNNGSDPWILGHQDTGSSAANRVICPNAVPLPVMPGAAVRLEYDFSASRWRAYLLPTSGEYPVAIAEITSGTAAGSVDVVGLALPASPSGNDRFVLTRRVERLKVAPTGSGTLQCRAGTTVGGNDIQTDQAVTSATTPGIVGGESISTLGTAMLAANGYELPMAASASVNERVTLTGTFTGAAVLRVYYFGLWMPSS